MGCINPSPVVVQALLLLGLSGRPSPQEVSKVRRQMALRWHPDARQQWHWDYHGIIIHYYINDYIIMGLSWEYGGLLLMDYGIIWEYIVI